MKIVTWNVNSLNAREQLVARFLDTEAPDVLALQELKMEADQVPRDLFISRGYQLAVHAQKRWNGVLIASRLPMSDVELGLPAAEGDEARVVAATVAGVRIVNTYCPQGQAVDSPKFPYKLAFFDGLIASLRARVDPAAPWILLGDLNIAPRAEDVYSVEAFRDVPTHHPLELERWAALTSFGLSDLFAPRVPAGTFTFWDYRGGAFHKRQGMRIDHFLGTPPVDARVLEVAVEREWRKKVGEQTPSDHAPVRVTLAD